MAGLQSPPGTQCREIAEKLHEKGIEVKAPTLAKYLNEFRRGKDRKKDTPPPPEKTASTPTPAPKPDRLATAEGTASETAKPKLQDRQ